MSWKNDKNLGPWSFEKSEAWKSKDLGPWSFTKQPDKLYHNQGDRISSAEDPTFNIDFTGEPVTPTHKPCGYWHSVPKSESGISIGYTIQQMAVDEIQTLSVTGAIGGYTYDWAITSGSGELSAESGINTNYTAPGANPNCENNPIITLSVNGEVCDTLALAINNVSKANVVIRCTNRTCPEPCVPIGANCGCCYSYYGCNGENNSPIHDVHCDCLGITENASSSWMTCEQLGLSEGIDDRRSDADIAAGCCPEQLL